MRRAIPIVACFAFACTNPQVTEPQSKALLEAPSSDEYQAVTLDDSLCSAPIASGCRVLVLFPTGACDPEQGSAPATSEDVDGVAALYRDQGASLEGTLCVVVPAQAICGADGTAIDRNDRAWRACK